MECLEDNGIEGCIVYAFAYQAYGGQTTKSSAREICTPLAYSKLETSLLWVGPLFVFLPFFPFWIGAFSSFNYEFVDFSLSKNLHDNMMRMEQLKILIINNKVA